MSQRRPLAPRLAIVVSHPIQYYAPWFAYLTGHLKVQIKVFYLWDPGLGPVFDPGFNCEIEWGLDLLTGYDHCYVSNSARQPGPHHFMGLDNPEVTAELAAWHPDAILLFGYNYLTHLRILTSRHLRHVPMLFRGDSHLLVGHAASLGSAVRKAALRMIFRRFSAFLSPGPAHTAYLEFYGVERSKIFRVPHAVDNSRFLAARAQAERDAVDWKRQLGIPASHRVILFAGKFEPKKCPDVLLRAFGSARIPDVTLLFVGSGKMESELRCLATEYSNVVFAPFQNQRRMPRVYAAADLVVLPSYGLGESWGLVINEALCCGKAVVVTDHVGCHPQLVQSKRNGIVVRAGDQEALSAALAEALRDPARLKTWGENGREIIADFCYEAATAGLQQALTPILAHRSRR